MNEEAFREIMTEILESKVELLQALEDWGKKFDNLIKSIARDFIKSEPTALMNDIGAVIGFPPLKKESTTKVKEKVINKDKMNALDVESYEVIKKSYLIKDHGQKAFIGQSLVKSIEKTKEGFVLYFTEAAQIWFTYDKINWEEDT